MFYTDGLIIPSRYSQFFNVKLLLRSKCSHRLTKDHSEKKIPKCNAQDSKSQLTDIAGFQSDHIQSTEINSDS